LKPRNLTLLSLLFSLFFLCDFVDSFFFGIFFFTSLMAVLTVHVGLLKVVVLEGSLTLVDLVVGNPVRTVTSIAPSLEDVPFLGVWMYSVFLGIYVFEIVLFRFLSRRYLPSRF
jgi:hypothetical protein